MAAAQGREEMREVEAKIIEDGFTLIHTEVFADGLHYKPLRVEKELLRSKPGRALIV